MAKLATYADKRFDVEYGTEDWRRAMATENAALDELLAASNALPAGKIVGHVMRFQRGDGYAFYVVTKNLPLTLAWIPYGDRWRVEAALIRGIRRADVMEDQRQAHAINKLFGAKKARASG